jgi:hypothetical protein
VLVRLGTLTASSRDFGRVSGRLYEETMITLLISVAFAFAVTTSAEAMSPAPFHEPGARVTHIADGQPCEVRIWGPLMSTNVP